MTLTGPLASGRVLPGFEPLRDAFEAVLGTRPGHGAALAVYVGPELAVDLWGGPTYGQDSLQLVFSASKGVVAICASHLAQRGLVDLDEPLASIWPAFGRHGKGSISLRHVLSHQAGLPTVDASLTLEDVLAVGPAIGALEDQRPYWEPGTGHGYHAWTLGHLVGEAVLRTTGRTLGAYWAAEIARPFGLDVWIGLPEAEEPRVVPVRTDEASMTLSASPEAARASADPASLTARVFANPAIDPLGWNARSARAAEAPAINGVASARGLARMYAVCHAELDGHRLLDGRTLATLRRPHAVGHDLVNLEDNRFGLGVYLPFGRLPFAGPTSFGHDGLGGALGFGDTELGLGFGFVTDLVPPLGGADPATSNLIEVLKACLDAP